METLKTIRIGGVEYPMKLNLNATELIGEKFGGMAELGEMLTKPENLGASIDTVAELVVILTTQGIAYNAFFNGAEEQKPLTVEAVRLLCSPYELRALRSALLDSITDDAEVSVQVEPAEGDEKN